MNASLRRMTLGIALAAASLSVAGGAAAAPDSAPVAAIEKAFHGFNVGDMKEATAAFADEGQVTDEFAPYQWRGPGAFTAWLSGLSDWEKARGRTGDNMKVLSVTRSDVDGDTAYVVTHMLYSFKEHGRRMSEPGDFAFVLHNTPAGWKVTAMSWAGGRPGPAVMKARAKPMSAPAAAAPKKS